MKKLLSLLLATAMIAGMLPATASAREVSAQDAQLKNLVQYVDPLIGSDNFKGNSEFAGLAPFVTAPFGMTNFTPQTRENRIGDISYMSKDTKITGFFASHQPAIWMGDYGYVNVMPQPGETIRPSKDHRGLSFSHDDEVSTPYYYSVVMDKENSSIKGEITATERCAIYRFTFPEGGKNSILVESARGRGNGNIVVNTSNDEIYGWNNDNMSSHLNNKPPKNLKGYFAIQFDTPIVVNGTYSGYQVAAGSTTAQGQKSGAYVTFDTEPGQVIEMRIGTSFLSERQARANITQEIGDKSFSTVSDELENVWNEKLNTIQIEGADDDENAIFYTAMFHASMYPRKFFETVEGVNKYFSPYDDKVHTGKSYTDFSLWDTFRAQNSFLTLIHPELIDEMITSLLQNYQQGGYMPKWPNPGYTNIMIGTHADSLVAEAIGKGLLDESKYDLAWEAVFKDAMYQQDGDGSIMWNDRLQGVPYEARGGLGSYKKLGYVANGYASENVSRTLEFSYDDWCVAQVAQAVGKEDEYKFFLNRSLNYQNAISPTTGFATGRDKAGNWGGGNFTEGNSKKYTWFALHDPQGLINYMAEHMGADFYNKELEKAWTENWLEQQNEPCHHYAYMFDFSGRPDLTQKYARETLLKSYSNDHAGMLGNDDCGQMSAWYVFSAMGFYPVNPASGEYMVGSPIFDKVTIRNPKTGKDFVITAENNNDPQHQNTYIQSATLNGAALNIPMLTHAQITAGGAASFVMGSEPSNWAKDYRKDAIVGDPTVTIPDPKPVFLGNSTVTRHFDTQVKIKTASADGAFVPENGGDLGDPGVTLIDGNKGKGYKSKDVTQSKLDQTPLYLTFAWDTPQDVADVVVTGNYPKKQGIYKITVETKTDEGSWTEALADYTIPWQTDGDANEEQRIKLPAEQKGITGLRIWVKTAGFNWGGFAVREVELFGAKDEKIDKENPQDILFKVNYNSNKLIGISLNGTSLAKDTDYVVGPEDETVITIKKEALKNLPVNANTPIVFTFNVGKAAELFLNVTESGAVQVWYAPFNIGTQVSQVEVPDGWLANNKDSFPPLSMFDGDIGKGYASVEKPAYPHSIDAAWDDPQSFDKVAIYSNYAHEQGPTNVSILVSEDGATNWTPVVENVELTWQPNDNNALPANVIAIPERVTNVKGVRLQINKANTTWGKICIREIEVYDEEIRFLKQKPVDIAVNVVVNDTALSKVEIASQLLMDSDYTLKDNTLTIKSGYLKTLDAGVQTVKLTFENGKTCELNFTVLDVPQYTITATVGAGANGATGMISPSGESTVKAGGNRMFILRPGSSTAGKGCVVDKITVDNVEKTPSAHNRFLLENVQADTAVEVTFREKKDIAVTTVIDPVESGSITPAGVEGVVTVPEEGSQVFTFTPAKGYAIEKVEVDGQAVELIDNTYTLENVVEAATIKATFRKLNEYKVTLEIEGGGTVTPAGIDGVVTVGEGQSETFLFTPGSGNIIETVKVDNEPVTLTRNNKYTLENIQADTAIYVKFSPGGGEEPAPHDVTVAASDNGVVKADPASAVQGTEIILTIVPDKGYELDALTVSKTEDAALKVDVSNNKFMMPDYDVTVTATFKKTAEQVAVEAAKTIVEGGAYTVAQAAANTEEAVQTWLESAIANLDGMRATSVTVSTITTADFVAAVADTDGESGSDGSVTFTATLTKGGSSVTTDDITGTITKTPYTPESETEAPVFVHSTAAFADAEAVSVTLSLAKAVEDTEYKVYSVDVDGEALDNPAVSAEGSTLTLTFTEKPENETIYYISAIKGDKVESDRTAVTVKPYAAPPEADTSSIDEAIAGANEAKMGISINENPESSVSQGVKYVTQAEMDALTNAIATAEAAKETVETTAEAEAVAADLDVATDTFKTAIKTGAYVPTYTPPSGGSNTTTETEKNPDGSTTKTVTNKKTGEVTETTNYPDGTKIVATTPKDGETTIKVTVPKDKENVTVTIPTKEQPKSGEVAVIVHEDGTREIIKTSVATKDGLRVTLTGNAKLEIMDNSKRFADVPDDHWGADAIAFVTSRELFNGGDGGFQPVGEMSRAMLFTVLARLDGQDLTGGATWYENAMVWAKESGVSDGTNPEQSITRESLAVMLYRYAGSPEVEGMALGEFTDSADVSGWASDAMLWCVEQGILNGSGGNLNPSATATRAEVAQMLQRFISL